MSDPDPEIFENADAVIHLAGESIAEGIWTNAKKSAFAIAEF